MIVDPRRPAPGRDRPARRSRSRRARTRTRSRSSAPAGRRRTSPRGSPSSAAQARFVGKRADDEAGGIAAAGARALRRRGARAGRRGPHRHGRLARRGRRRAARWPPTAASRPSCAADELDPAWLDGCTHLHLPGYSLLRSPIDEAALRAAGLAPRVSVDLSSWSAIRDFGPERFRERLEALRPAIVFANEDEERILGGPLDGCTWVAQARRRSARASATSSCRPCRPRCVDTTGAGDALAAGYLVGGPELALAAAARCVAKLGSMP